MFDLLGNGWEWTSTPFRAAAGIRAVFVLSRLFGQFLRRQAFRDEGRIAAHRRLHAAPVVPQLVPAALSVRVRHFPLRGGISHGICSANGNGDPCHRGAALNFRPTWSIGLSHPGQKELPSKYLVRRSGLGALRRDLPSAGIRPEPRGNAHARAHTPREIVELRAGAGGRGGARQRQRAEDALAAGSARAAAARELLPDRYFRQRAFSLPAGTRPDGSWSASSDSSAPISTGFRKSPRGGARANACFVLFLGSTIGNFDRPAGDQFLREVRAILARGRRAVAGDRPGKAGAELKLAYDDPAGVTAAFNKNLLARINRELDADFDLSRFRARGALRRGRAPHRDASALEGLAARHDPQSGLPLLPARGRDDLDGKLAQIRSAGSDPDGRTHGYRCAGQWFDAEWPFAQNLFFAV